MTISRAPAVLFIRHAFRQLGFRREILFQFERTFTQLNEPDMGDVSMVRVNETNLPPLMSQGLMPDSQFLSILRKVSKRAYEKRKSAILKEVYERMANGDVGFAGICQGRPIGWIWVLMQDHKYEPDIDYTIQLDKGSSMAYNIHIYPEFQRKGYGSLLFQYALHYRFNTGATKFAVLIEHDNTPSIKATLRLGFKPTKRIKRIELPGYSRTTVEDLVDAGG